VHDATARGKQKRVSAEYRKKRQGKGKIKPAKREGTRNLARRKKKTNGEGERYSHQKESLHAFNAMRTGGKKTGGETSSKAADKGSSEHSDAVWEGESLTHPVNFYKENM